MTKSATTHILSTGVTVLQSVRRGNRTGYTGAALSPAWTLDSSKPFIAACGNPTDHTVMAVVNAQQATCLHLGHYADAREAAYVIGMYRKDPINTINYVQSNGQWDHFPEDLYDLPEGLSYTKALEILGIAKDERKLKKSKVSVKDTSVTASGNIYDFFTRDQIIPIAKALGGPEQFQAAISGKSIADFAAEHGLTVTV